METLDAIRGRKSIRAFLPTPVPKEVISRVLDAARWAPSGANRQPWHVTVATGAACAALAARLAEHVPAERPGQPQSRPEGAGQATTPESRRVRELVGRMQKAGGISRRDIVAGSYRFWGAPAIVVLSRGDGGSGSHSGDNTRFVTTMLLAAHDLGLGTCWLGYPLRYADIIKESLGIPGGERPTDLVAMGYPDPDAPINSFRSSRDDIDTFVRWVGFD